MKNVKILIADEDQNTVALRSQLVSKSYDVIWVQDGLAASEAIERQDFDFFILEMTLMGKDGITLAKEIRGKNKHVPILFLSAQSQEKDIITAFKAGCDDYVQKPYSIEELLYRIGAILKRVNSSSRRPPKQPPVYIVGSMKFNVMRQTLTTEDKVVHKLTTKETALLALLCEYKNRLLERSEALFRIWGDDGYFNARSMDVYITKLRRFLKNDPSVNLINIHGVGFKLVDSEDNKDA